MATAKTTNKTARKAPDFAGVPGALVDSAPEGMVFGLKKWRVSPYDPLLEQLRKAGAGKFLKFDDLRCRISVSARAKKLGIKVLFGEQGNTLFVTLATAELQANGVVEEQPKKPSNSDLVLAAIREKRHTAGEIVSWLRSNGVPGAGITQVDGIIGNLMRAGTLKLGRAGSTGVERYVIA